MKKRGLCLLIFLLAIFCLVGCKDDKQPELEIDNNEEAVYEVAVDLGFDGKLIDLLKVLNDAYKIDDQEVIYGVNGSDIYWKVDDDNPDNVWQLVDVEIILAERVKEYKVTFDSDGGTKVSNQTVESGKTIIEPKAPNKIGHKFLGWYVNGKKWNFSKDVVKGDVVLKAKWDAIKFDVVIKNGATEDKKQIAYGEKLVIETPVREGFTFLKWVDKKNKEVKVPETGLVIKDDIELKAVWSIEYNNFLLEELADGNFEVLEYKGTDTEVVIPGTVNEKEVVSINSKAFDKVNQFTTVTVPATIKTIGENAFAKCDKLTRVNVLDLGKFLAIDFENETANPLALAKNLYIENTLVTELVVPEETETVKDFALVNCEALTKVDFKNVKTFGKDVLKGCTNITSLVLRNKTELVTLFGGDANVPATLVEATLTFNAEDLGTIANVFLKGLTKGIKITLDETWTQLRTAEFSNTTVLSVSLPKTIAEVGEKVFNGCNNLTVLTVDALNEKFDSRNNCNALIETATNKLVAGTKATVIPNDVTTIGAYAFANLKDLDKLGSAVAGELVIPANVTAIEENAFAGLVKINKVVISENVVTMGKDIFSGCTNIKDATLPFIGNKVDSKETIAYLFNEVPEALETVTITKMTTLFESAFEKCENIKSVVLPTNITTIEKYAFRDCKSLQTIVIPEEIVEIAEGTFQRCVALTKVTLGSKVKTIAKEAFRDCGKLAEINMPASLETIGESAFRNCASLTNITLEEGIKTIDYAAFYGCKALKTVNFPASLEKIGHSAFRGCQSLTEVVITENIKTIEYGAFVDCGKLVIKCKLHKAPATWNPEWNLDNNKVVWDFK